MKAGKIIINDSVLLSWLNLEGGTIHNVFKSQEQLGTTVILTHYDFPLVEDGKDIPIVTPTYTKTYFDIRRDWPKRGLRSRLIRTLAAQRTIWR